MLGLLGASCFLGSAGLSTARAGSRLGDSFDLVDDSGEGFQTTSAARSPGEAFEGFTDFATAEGLPQAFSAQGLAETFAQPASQGFAQATAFCDSTGYFTNCSHDSNSFRSPR